MALSFLFVSVRFKEKSIPDGSRLMAKSVSVYLEDRELKALDRLAKAERRSRSAMMGEVIRRYEELMKVKGAKANPLVREYTDEELEAFLREDRKVSPQEVSEFRKIFGLH
jgi:predicted transcriptional regulator